MVQGRSSELFERLRTSGAAAVDELIEQAVSEELFLDFKRSGTPPEATKLHETDRQNLARAISGFGNSEGGVVVWGVDCRPNAAGADVAGEKYPISNPTRFKSWLEGAIGGLTVPPHGAVGNHVIDLGDGTGFVATHIPKSNHAPHQTTKDLRYLMRAGSNFLPVPHSVLSGLFGRRPQPRVFQAYISGFPQLTGQAGVRWELMLFLHNGGLGIASYPFISLTIWEVPGDNCQASFSQPEVTEWRGSFSFGRKVNLVAREGVKLAPGAELQAVVLTLELRPPFSGGLRIAGHCGAEGSETFPFALEATQQVVENAVRRFLSDMASGQSDGAGRRFQEILLLDKNDIQPAPDV